MKNRVAFVKDNRFTVISKDLNGSFISREYWIDYIKEEPVISKEFFEDIFLDIDSLTEVFEKYVGAESLRLL